MGDQLEVKTNGTHRIPWGVIVAVLWGLLIGVFSWTANREVQRTEERLKSLESEQNSISYTTKLRGEDKALLDQLAAEQRAQGKLLARIAERVGVKEN